MQKDMEAVAERIPLGTFVTVEDGGHMVHEQRPKEFAAAVQTFLAGGAPAR
ncbi:alpha/beta fold hydrolase [Streptomyces sp. WMMB 322]|uniref:alpha/beta fold hydrolase n=1 Tax=Streptomyces sp. WMMB 322 TaxID=1286821 RepID=UPI0011130C91|nr:alpha/beta hydrolase [Streptomyces sp. WMMB 322]